MHFHHVYGLSFIENRVNYLFNISSKGTWDDWLAFCLRATVYQAKDAIKRCDQLISLKEEYSELLIKEKESARLNKLVEMFFEHPVFTIPQVSRWLNVTYPTARNDVMKLIKLKLIMKFDMTHGRSKSYLAPKVLKIAYTEHFDE